MRCNCCRSWRRAKLLKMHLIRRIAANRRSFTFGEHGIRGLLEQERLHFSIEADLELSKAVVDAVNRQIREMRRPSGEALDADLITSGEASDADSIKGPAQVRERNLRYRIEIEMLPRSGTLRVADEYLAALNAKGEPTRQRKPFIERRGEKIIYASRDKPTQPISRGILTTASYPGRSTRPTIHTWWRHGANWRTGCSSTLSHANGCVRSTL